MKSRIPVVIVSAAVAGLCALPASAQSREQRQMMAALQILQEQAQQLAIAVATLQQNVDEQNRALATRIDDGTTAARRGLADQKITVDNLAGDVRIIRERTDDTNVRIAALREELEALRSTVLALSQSQPALTTGAPTDPAQPGTPSPAGQPPATTPPAPPVSTAGLSPTRMLDTAKADYFAGQWNSAVNGFEAFLRAFPRSESAGEAQFYIGESLAAQSRWVDATAAYSLVIQNYPTSSSVPDAYYKRGLAQERAGQVDAAKASWEAAVRSYPDSDAGRLSRQSIERLGARRP